MSTVPGTGTGAEAPRSLAAHIPFLHRIVEILQGAAGGLLHPAGALMSRAACAPDRCGIWLAPIGAQSLPWRPLTMGAQSSPWRPLAPARWSPATGSAGHHQPRPMNQGVPPCLTRPR
jgi:hypothetical protein